MPPKVKEVDTGWDCVVQYPDRAHTDGIFTCVGAGILNKQKRIGYLCHLAGAMVTRDVEEHLARGVRQTGDPANLEVAVAGHAPLTFRHARFDPEVWASWQSMEKQFRIRILNFLLKCGILPEHLHCHFAKDRSVSFEIDVNTAASTIDVREHPTEE